MLDISGGGGLLKLIKTIPTALLIVMSQSICAESPRLKQPNTLNVEQLMSAKEFKAAGLDKLSSEEIEALNQWLSIYSVQLFQTVQGVGTKGVGNNCSTVIESQIEGEFNGWDGETIFKLANGQIWQQSSYAYTYHYAYRPEVTIFQSGGACKMKVKGVNDSITVKRLR